MAVREARLGTYEARSCNHYIFRVFVCSLSYITCKAHEPYYIVICGLFISTILSTLSHRQHTIFGWGGGVIENKTCVLIFLATSV